MNLNRLSIGAEIRGARFYRAWHVGNVPHTRTAKRIDSRVLILVASLTVCGAIAATAERAPYRRWLGVEFIGVRSYVNVDDSDAFDLEAFTLAVWVKSGQQHASQVLVGRGDAGRLFTFYFHESRVRMLVEYQPGKYTHANCPVPPKDVWTHLAGSYDGQQIKLYVNGALQATVSAPGRIPQSDAPLLFGALSPGQRTLLGQLEDIRIWRRALTAQEIATVAGGDEGATQRAVLVGRWISENLDGANWLGDASSSPTAKYFRDFSLEVRKADGYRGIWYQCGVQGGEYKYKYSGGLGTYCAKHRPFAVYVEKVNKTFFCYGGTDTDNRTLLHMVSYYDHATGTVPRPTILLDKHTTDAHDNPVISIDAAGHIWIFSSAHGTARPAFISVSKRPYDIDEFEYVLRTNCSYPQPYYSSAKGFLLLHTRYVGEQRLLYQTASAEGRTWSEPKLLSAVEWGHYQVSGRQAGRIGTAFNYHRAHPRDGSHWRTNLYYMQTDDFGATWQNAAGETLQLPLNEPQNAALVHDYEKEVLDVYVKDVAFDSQNRPIVLCLASLGNEAGPHNDPRTWRTARWTGREWEERDILVSDNNYDTGSLYVESDSLWRLIAPTQPGPQKYNAGGEVAIWISTDQGTTWEMVKQLTRNSLYNHTYCRRPDNAAPDFYALWADGHGREPSPSRLYFTDRDGTHVWRLPEKMESETARPEVVR